MSMEEKQNSQTFQDFNQSDLKKRLEISNIINKIVIKKIFQLEIKLKI